MESLLSVNVIEIIGQFLIDYPLYSIFAMIAAFILRGEVATLFAVYLAQQGYVGWFKFLAIGFFSIAFQDLMFYYLGRYGRGTVFGKWLNKKIAVVKRLKIYLKNHTYKILILTKYTVGFGNLTVMLSGWSKIKVVKFLKANLIADALWFGTMIGISFSLIEIVSFFNAKELLDSVLLILGAIILIIFASEYFIQKYLVKESKIEEEIHRN